MDIDKEDTIVFAVYYDRKNKMWNRQIETSGEHNEKKAILFYCMEQIKFWGLSDLAREILMNQEK